MQTLDKRCIKTKRAIKTALATLMARKDISDISVTEIAQAADVNRKTFYSHYSSVYDVLDEIEGDIVEELTELIEQSDYSDRNWNPEPLFKRLTELITSNAEFYRYLFEETSYTSLFERVKSVLKGKIGRELAAGTQLSETRLETAAEYIAGGTLSAYRIWLSGDRSMPLDEVSDTIRLLSFSGYDGLSVDEPHRSTHTSVHERAAAKAKLVAARIQQNQMGR